jgi:hypothetical protein
MKEREPIFWDCEEECDHLSYTDQDEAIEYFLDGAGDLDKLPNEVKVYGFSPLKISDRFMEGDILEYVLERFDEDFAGEDSTEPTDSMIEAEREFLEKVKAEYKVWPCEVVKTETINVQDWIKENRPDWLLIKGE